MSAMFGRGLTICTYWYALVHDKGEQGHYDAQQGQEYPILAQPRQCMLPYPWWDAFYARRSFAQQFL